MNTQLIGAKFHPKNLFGVSHVLAKFFCTLKFFFGDPLTGDDVFDRHGVILIQDPSPFPAASLWDASRSPKGEEPMPSKTKRCFAMDNHQTNHALSSLPKWEGRGDGWSWRRGIWRGIKVSLKTRV
jgi:hypothetical protein